MAQPDQPRAVEDELVRGADRDVEITRHLLGLATLVDRLVDDVVELRAELAAERLKRERIELRLNAEWLRDRGLTVDPTLLRAAGCGVPDDEPIDNVVELIRDYSPEAERIPTTDVPTPDSIRADDEGGDTVA